MGQHTWFCKSSALYKERSELYEKLGQHENFEIYLDDIEVLQIETKIDEIEKLNETDFHDCFRTSKRELNGQYTQDVIYSKQECDKWIEDNKDTIYSMDKDYINKFWNEYPDGVIYF